MIFPPFFLGRGFVKDARTVLRMFLFSSSEFLLFYDVETINDKIMGRIASNVFGCFSFKKVNNKG
jgi:hypothetical protein